MWTSVSLLVKNRHFCNPFPHMHFRLSLSLIHASFFGTHLLALQAGLQNFETCKFQRWLHLCSHHISGNLDSADSPLSVNGTKFPRHPSFWLSHPQSLLYFHLHNNKLIVLFPSLVGSFRIQVCLFDCLFYPAPDRLRFSWCTSHPVMIKCILYL